MLAVCSSYSSVQQQKNYLTSIIPLIFKASHLDNVGKISLKLLLEVLGWFTCAMEDEIREVVGRVPVSV